MKIVIVKEPDQIIKVSINIKEAPAERVRIGRIIHRKDDPAAWRALRIKTFA